jgi:hypothetical protein
MRKSPQTNVARGSKSKTVTSSGSDRKNSDHIRARTKAQRGVAPIIASGDAKVTISQNPNELVFKHYGFSRGASRVVTLNAYPNGISISSHKPSAETSELESSLDPFFLRTRETRDLLMPEGKFLVYRDNCVANLDSFFSALSKKGALKDTIVFLGSFTDCFHGFHKKFAQTMACLDIIERYQPGALVIQSRSRMLLTALPLLKIMGRRAHCVIPFETRLEGSIARYTPGQPRLEERLITAAGLRAQGVDVTLSVCPILPYGNTSGDAWKFAEALLHYSDKIMLQSMYGGERQQESILKQLPLSRKLESDSEFSILRPGAHEELRSIIQKLSPQHLEIPLFTKPEIGQLDLFAA